MSSESRPAGWKIVLAFGIIYIVWGSTYLYIRMGVREIPPFMMAGLRFVIAGLALSLWMKAQGVPFPTNREWVGCFQLAALMFLMDYSCLFWAEQKVASGIAAVILATIPLFITALEIAFLRTMRLTLPLGMGLLIGIFGVLVLMNNSYSFGEAPLDRGGVLALTVASIGWSVGTILSRKIAQPASKPMSAGLQMLFGGLQILLLSIIAGEAKRFHPQAISRLGWFSLAYLVIAGSIIGYTAYVWLLHYESPTRVGTYAYVNPVVAVILGYFLGGELVGPRTIIGTTLVLASVVTITISSKSARVEAVSPILPRDEAQPAAD